MFRKRITDPNRMIKIGMLAMIPAGLSRLFLHPSAGVTENMLDGVNGFLYGISIGGMMLGIWIRGRQRRDENCR